MTSRKLIGYGLIAGLRYDEIMRLEPGAVLDFYIMRVRYDDEQHGIKRTSASAWEEE